MDRADNVVELEAVDQVLRAILATGNEVDLEPEAEVCPFAHELAVVVDVIDCVTPPERVVPDRERLLKAVDVLGDAELADTRGIRRSAVARGIFLREVLRGSARDVIAAQMDVVVGEHAPIQSTRRLSSSSARFRSSGVVTLRFSAGAGTTRTVPPERSTSMASSVACAISPGGE